MAVPSVPVEAVTSVEDFVPDGGVIDKSFLEDAKEVKDSGKTEVNSDSDRWGELSISLVYMRTISPIIFTMRNKFKRKFL